MLYLNIPNFFRQALQSKKVTRGNLLCPIVYLSAKEFNAKQFKQKSGLNNLLQKLIIQLNGEEKLLEHMPVCSNMLILHEAHTEQEFTDSMSTTQVLASKGHTSGIGKQMTFSPYNFSSPPQPFLSALELEKH